MALIYLFWWIWENKMGYYPVNQKIDRLSSWLVGQLYQQSIWLLEHLFHPAAWFDGKRLCLGEAGTLTINNPCSGIKQFGQLGLLLLFYPGPWYRKTWYIPAGLLIVHMANIVRIVGLSLVIIHLPQHWNFFHDYAAKGLFYLVIFLLWMIWESRISPKRVTQVRQKTEKRFY
jgi:exosortase/archaeosortase family protein